MTVAALLVQNMWTKSAPILSAEIAEKYGAPVHFEIMIKMNVVLRSTSYLYIPLSLLLFLYDQLDPYVYHSRVLVRYLSFAPLHDHSLTSLLMTLKILYQESTCEILSYQNVNFIQRIEQNFQPKIE